MKTKFKTHVHNFIKNDGLTAIIAVIVFVILYIYMDSHNKNVFDLVDWTIFSSIILAMIFNQISDFIKYRIVNKLEDSIKLTTDYENLISKYKCDFIEYDNKNSPYYNKLPAKLKSNNTKISFPVICDYVINDYSIEIQDSQNMYTLPDSIINDFDELFAAHNTSTIYNQLNIRVDNWEAKNRKFVIKSSRTTYYFSLVTNRAMDFKLNNTLSIRDKFEYGPLLNNLSESQLSNHLGFNGFVESSDGYIPFIKRNNDLSIGKSTYGDSIGSSLNTKYALNNLGNFDIEHLLIGIKKEIKNELKIPQKYIEPFSPKNHHIITAYRDIVEGGKPQLLFYVKSTWSKKQIENNFKSQKNICKKPKNESTDGRKILWIKTEDIHKLCITPQMIIYKNKRYNMMPSASASIVMLIDYLNKN